MHETPPLLPALLPAFDPAHGLDAVRAAFAETPTVTTRQAWRATPESDFAPTPVRTGYRPGRLWVLAEMADADIFNTATAHNQNTWETGDVFEIFLRREDEPGYTELHVTPDNLRLHLRFPDREAIQRLRAGTERSHALYHADPDAFSSWVWRTADGWTALAAVPAEPGAYRYSFCRYDAHPDRAPTVASTSPHAVANFHALDDWLPLRLR